MDKLIVTFDTYLNSKFNPMTFQEMHVIHQQILSNADTNDEDFNDCWKQIIKLATKYFEFRMNWQFMSNEEKLSMDPSRTATHNNLINDFIMLERIFKLNNWDSKSWTKLLFLQDEVSNRNRRELDENRKRIGDFANYLVFVGALSER